jgi:hypothetical protein
MDSFSTMYLGATPVFADINPKTWNIDRRYDCNDNFSTPQEAYNAAFDYIKDYKLI